LNLVFIARDKNVNLSFHSCTLFILVFDALKMKDFQIQHDEVGWGGGGGERGIYNNFSLTFCENIINISIEKHKFMIMLEK
jgi:hypothetical protein